MGARLPDRPYQPPPHFPFEGFYPIPLALIAGAQTQWLAFLDILFSAMFQDGGLVCLNIGDFTRHRLMKAGTARGYLRRAEREGWLTSYRDWLRQHAANTRLLHYESVPQDNCERLYIIDPELLQTPHILYKPRAYVSSGWVAHRILLAERQVCNAFCLAWSEGYRDQTDRQGVELTQSQLKHFLRRVHGSTPRSWEDAAQRLLDDGILSARPVRGQQRYRFETAHLLRSAPAPTPLQRTRAEIVARLGLDPEQDAHWIDFLARIYDDREEGQGRKARITILHIIYNTVINSHPHLDTPEALEQLRLWASRRLTGQPTGVAWQSAIGEYIRLQQARSPVQQVMALLGPLHFRTSAAHGVRARWSTHWSRPISVVLTFEATPGRQPTGSPPYPRLAIYRQGVLHALAHSTAWQRLYQRVDVSALLKHLLPQDDVTVVAVLPDRDEYIRVKEARLLLGVVSPRLSR